MFEIAGGILIALAVIAVLRNLGSIITVLAVLWLVGHFFGH